MAIAELPRPGVEVIQEFRTVSPTIVAPTLVPCVVGVCNQIVEVLNADGTLNSDALLAGAASAIAPTAGTYDLDGKTLQVSVNGGPVQEFTFSGNALTAGQVATQITGSNPAPANFDAYAWSDGATTPQYHLQLRSSATGETRSIQIIGGSSLGDFGWARGFTYYGLGNYIQDELYIPQSQLPNPRNNIDELDFDEDSLRVFVDLGTEVREFVRTDAFLRSGSSIAIYDDADGDNTTPFVDLTENLLAPPTSASKTTTGVDFSTPLAVHNETLILQIDGSGKQTITLLGQPIVSDDSTGWAGSPGPFTGFTVDMNIIVNGSTVVLPFNGATLTDLDDIVDLVNTATTAAAGVNVAYRCDQYGLENASGDYIGFYYGAAPSSSTTANAFVSFAEQAGNASMTELFGATTALTQTNWGEKPHANWPINDIETQIDNVFGVTVADIVSTNLVLESAADGDESKIEIDENSTALTTLGFTAPYIVNGDPFAVRVGDDLYGDGGILGTILEVHSGGTQGRVKLETEVSTAATWSTWYIVSKNLETVDSGEYGISVPTPDFVVNTSGDLLIKHDILRDTSGAPIASAGVSMYIAYTALRLDVSSEAADPFLLTFDNVSDLDDALGPLNTDNPLGYGLFLCLSNAGAVTVSGIGVPEKTADKPYGTVEGYAKVWGFLESKEVYAIAVLTTDLEVALSAQVHVDSMSLPANKGERIAIVHLGTPDRKPDTVVVSGTDGDYLSGGPPDFDTKMTTLSQSLLALGIDPTNILTSDGVYVDLASDALRWNIGGGTSVTDGTKVAINTTFSGGQNDDGYYSEGTFPSTLISETFSIKVRGALVADKNEEISTIYARGVAFQDRRVWLPQLDTLNASIDGVESSIPGFYFTAAKAGMVAGTPPQTPFTNYPIAGFTAVKGTNDRYSKSQLNQGASGGAEWIIQEAAGVPLQSRHQLTTNMTSIETREQSIVKAIDFSAKFMRIGLRNFIGRYNITPNFLDTLSAVVQGQLKWLMDRKIISEGDLNNILQDADNPDTVLIDVTIVPMYPCNYIRLTIII